MRLAAQTLIVLTGVAWATIQSRSRQRCQHCLVFALRYCNSFFSPNHSEFYYFFPIFNDPRKENSKARPPITLWVTALWSVFSHPLLVYVRPSPVRQSRRHLATSSSVLSSHSLYLELFWGRFSAWKCAKTRTSKLWNAPDGFLAHSFRCLYLDPFYTA